MAQEPLILDRYQPLGTAGRGGFGTVQIAWDVIIQRKVAIKTIQLSELDARRANLPGAQAAHAPAPAAVDSPTADRWHGLQPWNDYLQEDLGSAVREQEPVTALAHLPGLDEARTAAMLVDPRIVAVYDFEVRDRTAYLIMEYVEGITLTRLLADYEDYLTLDVVAAVFDSIAGALSVAHKSGVLHLDIKPDNIIVNPQGQVKVTDFGLATLADASGTGKTGGGTIGYMPLEQIRREHLDARTDEWSLAAVAYEMLAGDNPFRARNLAEAEAAIEDAELVVPSLCWDDIDEQVDDVIFYALDPDRDRRYASVADFAEELDKFLGDAEAGKRQLAAIVRDALGVVGDDEGADGYDDPDDYGYDDCADYGYDDGGYDDGVAGASSERSLRRSKRRERRERPPRRVSDREAPGWLRGAAVRAVVAAAAALLAYFAAARLYSIAPMFGADAATPVALVCTLVVAVVAVIWPAVGVLVSCVLSGLALIAAGQAVVGATQAVVGIVWCYGFYQFGRDDSHPVWLKAMAVCFAAVLVALSAYLSLPLEFVVAPLGAAIAMLVSAFAR